MLHYGGNESYLNPLVRLIDYRVSACGSVLRQAWFARCTIRGTLLVGKYSIRMP